MASQNSSVDKNLLQRCLTEHQASRIRRNSRKKINNYFKEFQTSYRVLEERHAELQTKFKILNSDLENSNKIITLFENEIKEIEKASESLVKEFDVARIIKHKEADIKSLNLKPHHLTSDLEQSRQAAVNLKNSHKDKEIGFREQQINLVKENDVLTTNLTREGDSLNNKLRESQTALFNLKDRVTEMRRVLDNRTTALANTTNDKSKLEAEIKSLHKELELLGTANKNEVELMNKTLEYYKLEIESNNKLIENNKAQHEQALLKIKELSDQLVKLDAQYQKSIIEYHELESKCIENVDELEEKLKDSLREIEFQKLKNEEFITEIISLKLDLETEKDKRKQQFLVYTNDMSVEIAKDLEDINNFLNSEENEIAKERIPLTSNNSTNELFQKNKELQDLICEKDRKIKKIRKEIKKAIENLKILNKKYETSEYKYKQKCKQHNKYKTQSEDMITQRGIEIEKLQSDCAKLEEDISVLRNTYENQKLKELQGTLTAAKENTSKKLNQVAKEPLAITNNQLKETTSAYIEKASIPWQTNEEEFDLIPIEHQLKLKYSFNFQNELTHEQIEHLTTLIPPLSNNIQTVADKEKIPTPLELIDMIKHERKEKELLNGKCIVYESTNMLLEKQVNSLHKFLDETNVTVIKLKESFEDKMSHKKYTELLEEKEKSLYAITDSNRLLREERDTLKNRVKELLDNNNTLKTEISPPQNITSELRANNELLRSENILLKSKITTLENELDWFSASYTSQSRPIIIAENLKRIQNARETSNASTNDGLPFSGTESKQTQESEGTSKGTSLAPKTCIKRSSLRADTATKKIMVQKPDEGPEAEDSSEHLAVI